jgi:transposase InsO family protein
MDTIGPLPRSDSGHEYIIVLIDTFTRYVELFPAIDVSAASAASALISHILRFGTPVELVTDNGTQFLNHMFTAMATHIGFAHFTSIPYSKEENGVVERANKEVNRHIRNILFDSLVQPSWAEHLELTAQLMNATVKESLGVSPHQLVFGQELDTHASWLPHTSLLPAETPKTVRAYIDDLVARQHRVLAAAQHSQLALDSQHISSRRTRQIKRGARLAVHNITAANPPPTPIRWTLSGDTWTRSPAPTLPDIIHILSDKSFAEECSAFRCGDYVLRKHPPSFARPGHPQKYGSYWRGPFLVIQRRINPLSGRFIYTLRNLVSQVDQDADISQLKPFYYDSDFVTPLNIAVKDTEEFVVADIVDHQFDTQGTPTWRVRWDGYDVSEDTWEPWDHLRDVEHFHAYCLRHGLDRYLPAYVTRPASPSS